MARSNGGLIGKRNVTSFGKCKVTSFTSNGNITTQSTTRVVESTVVAGGGGGAGGNNTAGGMGGGGAGGFQHVKDILVCGSTAYPMTIGGGGAKGTAPNPGPSGNKCGSTGTDTVAAFSSNPITSCGGGFG